MTDLNTVLNRAAGDFEYYFRFKKLSMNFEELWRMKSAARESLREWLVAVHTGHKTAEVIANSASELIENCIKYSIMDTFSSVYIGVAGDCVNIETVNSAALNEINTLKDFIDIISRKKNSLSDLFLKKITDSVSNTSSQIGLIKIIMESHGAIRLIDNENDASLVHLLVEMKTYQR